MHGNRISRFFESAVFIKRCLILIGNEGNSQIIDILALHHIHKCSSDSHPLIIGMDKEIMNICIHNAVIHNTNHAHKFFMIPCRIHGFEMLHRNDKPLRILSGGPLYRQKQIPQLFFIKYIGVTISYIQIFIYFIYGNPLPFRDSIKAIKPSAHWRHRPHTGGQEPVLPHREQILRSEKAHVPCTEQDPTPLRFPPW